MAVHFRNEREGWIAGQFNLILHTADGGATWEPWLDRTENPEGYSLHAIGAAGDDVLIVGELGLVLRLDAASQRFQRIKTPYPGTLVRHGRGEAGDRRRRAARLGLAQPRCGRDLEAARHRHCLRRSTAACSCRTAAWCCSRSRGNCC